MIKPRAIYAESVPQNKDSKPSGINMTLPAPEYLLFLKRRSDGRMECVTGQYDAALSCREMSEPPNSIVEEILGRE